MSYSETPKNTNMIKKLLLTSALFILGIIMLNAQCTPNSACAKLVCPDTITNLPNAQAGVLYSTIMTVRVPTDTTVSGYAVHVDSLNYTSITGLPTGFTATPNKSGWLGGTKGCLDIVGTAADSMKGRAYKLTITVTVNGKYSSIVPVTVPIPMKGYTIHVDSSSGISSFDVNKFSLKQNSPNPFSGKTTIEFNSPNNDKCSFAVINVIGEKVFEKTINATTGENKIEFSAGELPSGIYMYKLSNSKQSITKRMIVAGK